MASSFLRPSRGASRTKQTNGGPILSTKSEKTTITEPEWRLLGSAEDSLLSQLQSMYWAGVGSELLNIIDTLKDWQQQKLPSSTEQDELDDFIHGFDTFVDQVSESSRDFATKYRRCSFLEDWKRLCILK